MASNLHPLAGKSDLIVPVHKRRWLGPPLVVRHVAQTFGVAGRVWIGPIDVPWRVEVDAAVYCVGGTAAGNVRIGVYKEGDTIDRPDGGELVVESGSVAQPTTNALHLVDLPTTILEAGRYYVAIQGDDATGTFYTHTNATTGGYNPGRYYDHTYGPFEDPCPATLASTRFPIIFLRVSRNLV